MKTIWITGAGSGIGAALAEAYAGPGVRLILSGRKAGNLETVALKLRSMKAEVRILPLDLAEPDSLPAIVEQLRTELDQIDMLICNAGMSQRSFILETTLQTERSIFEVNFFGTVELSRLVLAWMLETGGGQMVVISSIAGKFGFPLRSAYSASKHALLGYYETMDLEYGRQGIAVSIICPGRIRTTLSMNALRGDGTLHSRMDEGLQQGMDVHKAARKIKKAIERRRYIYYLGGKELILLWMFKYVPGLFRRIARNVKPT